MLGQVFLCQRYREFLCSVVAEVDEDNHVALAYQSVDIAVVYRLYELVGRSIVIAFLHGSHQISRLLSFAADNEVVGFLDTFPSLVSVHSVVASDDACYGCVVVGANL